MFRMCKSWSNETMAQGLAAQHMIDGGTLLVKGLPTNLEFEHNFYEIKNVHDLKQLEDAGLIKCSREDYFELYMVRDTHYDSIHRRADWKKLWKE